VPAHTLAPYLSRILRLPVSARVSVPTLGHPPRVLFAHKGCVPSDFGPLSLAGNAGDQRSIFAVDLAPFCGAGEDSPDRVRDGRGGLWCGCQGARSSRRQRRPVRSAGAAAVVSRDADEVVAAGRPKSVLPLAAVLLARTRPFLGESSRWVLLRRRTGSWGEGSVRPRGWRRVCRGRSQARPRSRADERDADPAAGRNGRRARGSRRAGGRARADPRRRRGRDLPPPARTG
jgi:hypothetical protein